MQVGVGDGGGGDLLLALAGCLPPPRGRGGGQAGHRAGQPVQPHRPR